MSGTRKVHEIAKELGRKSKDLVEVLQRLGVDAKAANSPVTAEDEARLRAHLFGIKDGRAPEQTVSVTELLKPSAGVRLRKKAAREPKEQPSVAAPAPVAEAPPAVAEAPAVEATATAPAPAKEAAPPAKQAAPPGETKAAAPAEPKPAAPKPADPKLAVPPAAKPTKAKKPGAPKAVRDDLRTRILEEIESERHADLSSDAVRHIAKPAAAAPKGAAKPSRPAAGRPAQAGAPRRAVPDAVKPKGRPKPVAPPTPKPPPPKKKVVARGEQTLAELALQLDTTTEAIQKYFRETGNPDVGVTVVLDTEKQAAAANALGFDAAAEPRERKWVPRVPVVTVLGHVDHGKTTLLDAIRKTNVVASESGGITQHIGASVVKSSHGEIVFIDTPGHEVFTAMRARGAQVTDIVVLVVAADDGVMPQTIESINHARAAGVPVVVAVTKMDKAEADAMRVKKQLADHGVTTEDWGGQTLVAEVAALRNEGLDKVLENISLQAEIMELKGDVSARAEGVVIESTLDRGRGPVITVLIRRGALKAGDAFVVGNRPGRVRAMFDVDGTKLKEAGPSVPATVLGAEAVPDAGERLVAMPNDRVARAVAAMLTVEAPVEATREEIFSLDEWYKQMREGGQKELGLVIKADVAGSLEALREQMAGLGNDEVKTKILHGGVGAVNEGDVLLAGASRAVVIAFRVAAEPKAKQLAQREGVEIRDYDVIYEAIADAKAALEGLLEPEIVTEVVGAVEVRQLFDVAGGRVAGSFVRTGRVTRGVKVRVRRGDEIVYEGTVSSLRRFREDVREVQQGYECGIQLHNFQDVEAGDVIEILEERRIARRLSAR